MKQKAKDTIKKKSIFKALFVPLFLIMILQAVIFYLVAVYGGIEETMNQNAADILTERLINRKNEVETLFTRSWTRLDACEEELDQLYASYEKEYGTDPLLKTKLLQVDFLEDASPVLVDTLRSNGVNGIYLILNDQEKQEPFTEGESEEKNGLGIRDLDQTSNYTGTDDLLLERAPSSVIEQLGCSLDSWWEARYTFSSKEEGAYYYYPLDAAWENPDVASEDLAYFEGAHQISGSDQEVVSYSIPLMDEKGYPYGVLGVELTTKYLGSLLPSKELNDEDKGCYVLALENQETGVCVPVTGVGALYNRCFGANTEVSIVDTTSTGGFHVTGREGTDLYGDSASVEIYNNNNPFENMQLTLIALVEDEAMFSYIAHIRHTLAMVSLLSLALGLCGMLLVSRLFSRPITALAQRVQTMSPRDGFQLGRLGITEIDQLVDSIEDLNRNASRNIARTEFFSRMSHDMRTPMNAIISFSSKELLEGTDEAKKTEYLEKIHSSGQYLLGLINEVLDMTKIESNKVELQYTPSSTERIWKTIIPIIDKLAQQKDVTFEKKVTMEDTMVMVDEQHLNQIVMNLLSNAVKFTPEGGRVQLLVCMETDLKDTDQMNCQVIVSDNGIGMSEAFMQHLYRPFEQENEGLEGTGLGLSIAKKLIELMGGTIECSSKKGEGTTFTLKFALEKCTKEELETYKKETTEVSAETIKADTSLKGKRILVCEDHPLNTQIIVRVLEREGIEVVTAENGAVGVEKFASCEEGTFDAVLMDIRMPQMDGLEATRAIRKLDRADAVTVPIIAMTANAFAEDVRASKEAGMNAHLSKPIEPEKVYHTLRSFLK